MNESLKAIQDVEYELLQVVLDIVETYNLTAFAAYGTLLGTIRHRDFIPWDDDIDLLMMRNDYEAFISIAETALPEGYHLQNYKTDTSYDRYVTRVIKENTRIRLNSYESENEMSIWLDIFPLDAMPSAPFKKKVHEKRILFRRALYSFSSFEKTVNLNRPGRPAYQQAIIRFCHKTHFGRNLDTRKQLDKLDKLLTKYDPVECSNIGCFLSTYKRQDWPKECFFPTDIKPFRDVWLTVPGQYHEILTSIYGDYMVLPPEDKREIHHITVVDIPEDKA